MLSPYTHTTNNNNINTPTLWFLGEEAMTDNPVWNSLLSSPTVSLSLKQIEPISTLSYDYSSQLHGREPQGLDVTSGEKNLEAAADWDR